MAHSLTTIDRHLECAILAELVVELELALIKRKQSRGFQCNPSMSERYVSVAVGQGQRSGSKSRPKSKVM